MFPNSSITQDDGSPRGAGQRRVAPLALVLLGAQLAGCVSAGVRARQPNVPTPAGWSEVARVGASVRPARPDETIDLALWWQGLDDPLLTSLVERALSANLDLRLAQARLREARAQRGLAAVALLPTVGASVSGSGAQSGDRATQQAYSAGLDASWEVDLFGGTRRSLKAAEADLLATEASLHDTQVTLVAEVALAYVDVRVLQARLTIARANLARQTETLDLTRWRAEAGLTSSLDVEQSRANLEQTRAQLPVLEAGRAQATHRLALLLGLAPAALDGELEASRALPVLPEGLALGIPADTLRRRPDVRAAEQRVAAARARLGVARAARFPSLRLSGSIGLEALTLGGLADGATATRALLGGLTAPLFDRRKIRRQIDAQAVAEEQALLTYEKAVLVALDEVEDALAALASARQRQSALTQAAEAARNAALLARHRYTTGLADFQTVLDTERVVLSIEDSLQSSEGDRLQALIRLYKALGGGWSPSAPVAIPTRSESKES